MGMARTSLFGAVALLLAAGVATAQTATGTISGHVVDTQGLAVPGVTVTIQSPKLAGHPYGGDLG